MHIAFNIEKNSAYNVSILFDPAMLLIFIGFFVYYGTKIQCHVIRVKLSQNAHVRVLCQLNFFVTVITVCYLVRAFLVTGLFLVKGKYLDVYRNWDERLPFVYYTMLTQWLPFILTSYCLLYLMRKPPYVPSQQQQHQPQQQPLYQSAVQQPAEEEAASQPAQHFFQRPIEGVYFGFDESYGTGKGFNDSHASSVAASSVAGSHGGGTGSTGWFSWSGRSSGKSAGSSASSYMSSSSVFGGSDIDAGTA